MNEEVSRRLDKFIEDAWTLQAVGDYQGWQRGLLAFLVAIGKDFEAEEVDDLGSRDVYRWDEGRQRQVGYLEGLSIKLRHLAKAAEAEPLSRVSAVSQADRLANKVFIVHGHDVAAKELVARFLEKLDLVPIVLHEQANEGQTVIEKFELHASVAFAVVLLTPDDVGASKTTQDRLQGRARQNVIFELGYFTGKLGRRKVSALVRPGVEVPSDIHGVVFNELDAQGGWKAKLAQELVSAGLQINLQGLLQ